jgi:hypothetical protein
MDERKPLHIANEQLDRFLDELEQEMIAIADDLDADDVGGLSDDDAVGYALDALSAEDTARVEGILQSSTEAAEEMAWLRREAAAWRGPAGEKRLDRLARRLRWRLATPAQALAALREAVGHLFAPGSGAMFSAALQGALAADRGCVASGETPDLLLRWKVDRSDAGDLTVNLLSWATELEGTVVRLRVGGWLGDRPLESRPPDSVGATFTISSANRVHLGPGDCPALEIVG